MRVHTSVNYLAVMLALGVARSQNLDDFAVCGDCWCIPDSGDTCPHDSIPQTEWSAETIDNLLGITLENPISLSCDPYFNDQCDTDPPLESGSVCAVEISANGATCPEDYSYR
jgi:hypothetical protein